MARLLLLRGAMGAGKTSVVRLINEPSPEIVIIEVDDIKVKKYGTTERCNPAVDFAEAGADARAAMDRGEDAIVIEPLCEQQHIQYVLNGAGLSENAANVLSVWLHCSLETAIARKGQSHKFSVIESQHERYPNRYQLEQEIIIHTDDIPAEQVAEQIMQYLRNA